MGRAATLIETVFDADSFVRWDSPAPVPDDADYAAAVTRARERSGEDESVITGQATIDGRDVAIIASEFSFMAGSLGAFAAARLAAGVRRASALRLPLVAAAASGGTRMQEGTAAFVHMIDISAAIAEHRELGLPYLAYLQHPTTGGVLASWGSQAHIRVAEPGALIGFLGPKVYEALHGKEFPPGVQQAENLRAHGLVDGVLEPSQVRDVLGRALDIICSPGRELVPEFETNGHGPGDPWDAITRSRDLKRPGIRAVLRAAGANVIPLHGTGAGETEPGLLLALVRLHGESFVLLGQDRRGQTAESPLGPGALRQARRGMHLAQGLRLPLVTCIDTPGAALSKEAEEQGLAGEIAGCLADLVAVDAPTVSLILGPGTGGGAIALLPADVSLVAANAWLSPLPPEGAAAVLYNSAERAPEMSRSLGITSTDLHTTGVCDHIIAEHPDAAAEPQEFCERVARAVAVAVAHARLRNSDSRSAHERARRRSRRYVGA